MEGSISSWWPLFAADHLIVFDDKSPIYSPHERPVLSSNSIFVFWAGYFGQVVQERILSAPLFHSADGRDYLSLMSTSIFQDDADSVFSALETGCIYDVFELSLRERLLFALNMSRVILVVAPLAGEDEFAVLQKLLALLPSGSARGARILFQPDVDCAISNDVDIGAAFDGVVHTLNVAPERYPFRSAVKQTVLSRHSKIRTPLDLWTARRGWIARPFAKPSMAAVRQTFNEARIGLRHDEDFDAVHINFISDEAPGEAMVRDMTRLVSSLSRAEMLLTHSRPVGPDERSGIELGWFAPLRRRSGQTA